MRRTLLAVAALLALMLPTMGRADDSDTEKQVATLAKQFREAMVKGDTQSLDSIQADDWIGINPSGDVADKAKNLKNFKDGTVDFESIDDLSEVKVRVYGDAAVMTSRYHVKVKYKGEKMDNHIRVTEVYAKQGGKWRSVSRQGTRIAEPPK
jgi:ketosteroid isomerase-like protein